MGFIYNFKPICFGTGSEYDEECDYCDWREECDEEKEKIK